MDNYQIGKRISDGAFGTVYQGKCIKNNENKVIPENVAIKQVYTSTNNLKRQLAILKKLPKHPNIVQIFDIFEVNFTTNIVMEKGQYDLSLWISQNYYPISETSVKMIAHQILEGLKAVHLTNVIHRDLKPSNLVIRQNNQVALCDFGSAVQCTKGQEYEIEGFTRWYKCPQMLFGFRSYKYEVDIWSIGCILMQLATGQPLFNSKSQIEQISLIAQLLGDPSPQNWPSITKMPDYNKINFKKITPKSIKQISEEWSISQQLCEFIMKMIRYQNRPTAEELLKDKYFNDLRQNWSPVKTSVSLIKSQHKELLQAAKKHFKL